MAAEALLRDPAFREAVVEVLSVAGSLPPGGGEPTRDLAERELAILAEGAFREGDSREQSRALAKTMVLFSQLLKTGLTTHEAAQRLRVDDARVRQRLGDGTLYGIKTLRGEWKLPVFQFMPEGGEVPGIAKVLRSIQRDLHPVEVLTWFTSPDPEFEVHGEPLSPLSWLRSGGNAEKVAGVAAELGEAV
jgi:hypothetical protein